MKELGLTKLEHQVLAAHLAYTKESCGAGSAEDLLADNYSCIGFDDLAENTHIQKNVLRGVVGSLIKKNIIWIDARNDDSDRSEEHTSELQSH